MTSCPALLYRTTASLVDNPPFLDLGGMNLPQTVDLCGLARDGSLRHLGGPAEDVLPVKRVSSRCRLDPDDANARVIFRAVMLAVPEVTEPCLERLVVMLLDERPVCDDACLAGDGSPLSSGVDERNVDVRVV